MNANTTTPKNPLATARRAFRRVAAAIRRADRRARALHDERDADLPEPLRGWGR